MMRGAAPSLKRILVVRMCVVSALVSVALIAVFFAKYSLDTEALRRATLERDLQSIEAALREGKNPAAWPVWSRFPDAYAFRVFQARDQGTSLIVSEANVSRLPPPPPPSVTALPPNIANGVNVIEPPEGNLGGGRWIITDYENIDGRSLWVQVAMIGDPDHHWITVIVTEIQDHVLVPMLFTLPALAISLLLATTRALRPLERIAQQADELGQAVRSGAPLVALPEEDLPREFRAVVVALNAMLISLERSLQQQRAFTADVAHELRTPLALLRLGLDELTPGPIVENLKTDLDTVAALVNELLRLAQAEDAMARGREEIDLASTGRAVCEDLAPTALARGLALAFDAPPVRCRYAATPP